MITFSYAMADAALCLWATLLVEDMRALIRETVLDASAARPDVPSAHADMAPGARAARPTKKERREARRVAAATAATVTADHPVAVPPKTGTAGVGHPPRHLQVGPTKLPHPQGPQPLQSECGCLDDSPYLGFVGDEVEEDLMFNLN